MVTTSELMTQPRLTVPEYEKQVLGRRKVLEEAQKKVIEQQHILTQQQLRGISRTQRQQAKTAFEMEKQKKLISVAEQLKTQEQLEAELKPLKRQYESYQVALTQKAAYESEQAEWTRARELIRKGLTYAARGSLAKKINILEEAGVIPMAKQEAQYAKWKAGIAEFERETGAKLEIKGLEITGVEHPELGRVSIKEYTAWAEKKPQAVPRELWEDIRLRTEMTPQQMAQMRRISITEAEKDIEAAKQIYSRLVVEAPKPEVRPWVKKYFPKPKPSIKYDMPWEKYKPLERPPPGWARPEYKKIFEKVAKPAAAVLGIGVAPYVAPTVLAAPYIKKGIRYVPTIIKKIEEFAPEPAIILPPPFLEYKPAKPLEPSREWVAPTKRPFDYKLPFLGYKFPERDLTIIETMKKYPSPIEWIARIPKVKKAAIKIGEAIPFLKKRPPVSAIPLAREIEYKVYEPKGKKVVGLIEQVGEAPTAVAQASLHKKLKEEYGILAIPTEDPKTGKTFYQYEFPEWFKQLRPKFAEKHEKESFVPFIFRKLRYGVGETYEELFQRAVYKGPTILEPTKPVVITPTARKVGVGVGIGFQLGLMYTVPGAAPVTFLGGTIEAALRGPKPFVRFAREEPWEVAMAGTYGLARGIGYARRQVYVTPTGKITTKPTWLVKPKPKIPKVLEVQQPYKIVGVKEGRIITYVQRQVWKPGKYAIQPRWAAWIGKKPVIKYYRPQPTTIMPALRYITGKEYGAIVLKGKRPTVATYKWVKGGKMVSRREPFLAQKYLETWEGRLVPRKFALPVIGKKGKLIGWVETTKRAKIIPKRGVIDIVSPPKRELAEYFGKMKKVITLPEAKIYEAKMVFKDITRPGPRAAGKVFPLYQRIIVKRPIIIQPPPTGYRLPEFVTRFRRAPQLMAKPELVPRALATLGYVKPTVPQLLPIPKPFLIPKLMIAPKTIFTVPKVGVAPKLMIKPLAVVSVIPKEAVKVKEISALKIIPKQLPKAIIRPLIKPMIKPAIKAIAKPIVKAIPKIVLKPLIKPTLKPIIKPITKIAPKAPVVPIVPPFIILRVKPKPRPRIPFRAFKRPTKFVPFVRRYGKFIPVGKPTTLKRARRKGVEVLRRTLAATLEVRKVGTGEKIPIAKVTRKFRPRKGEDIFGLVERAPFRLEALEEVREIIASRKAGKVKFIK